MWERGSARLIHAVRTKPSLRRMCDACVRACCGAWQLRLKCCCRAIGIVSTTSNVCRRRSLEFRLGLKGKEKKKKTAGRLGPAARTD